MFIPFFLRFLKNMKKNFFGCFQPASYTYFKLNITTVRGDTSTSFCQLSEIILGFKRIFLFYFYYVLLINYSHSLSQLI
jgi:hypothetical protein